MSNPSMWDSIKYFTPWEFDDPNHKGSGKNIDPDLLANLEYLRRRTGCRVITHWQVGGCVDVDGSHGHADNSLHRFDQGCKAVDFHFEFDAKNPAGKHLIDNPRAQFNEVMRSGFTGVGVYYDWHWDGKPLSIGFHVDSRPQSKAQIWTRHDGNYLYFLK